ncbi:MAG: hypothetical protein ACLGHN_06040 [Bacteriovoracia bacterium]
MVSAKELNEGCSCITLDKNQLRKQLEMRIGEQSLLGLLESRPNLFSGTTVFLSPEDFQNISAIINSIEEKIMEEEFQQSLLKAAPEIARANPGPHGVFMGYDFHLGEDGPKLIEINTNAGGALLNLELAKAQINCCQTDELFSEAFTKLNGMEKKIYEMFLEEWNTQKSNDQLKVIAIVDDKPHEQFLYPEFLLFQKLFSRFNIKSIVTDPEKLEWKNETLWFEGERIDFVYNRLTDFYLEEETHETLRRAYESGKVVVSPSPRHHALYANKRNLTKMKDLPGIPGTEEVTPENAEDFWKNKKNYFFKPFKGYGSKATYRGDKLTKKVWEEISKGGYIAQELVTPGQRVVSVDGKKTDLKVDVRAYAYKGEIQLLAARLYSGQTTNFRTSGGGFAPVFVFPSHNESP